ncbi:MAG: hypothetical protein RR150_12575, partial [Clostridia bacterium]
MIMTEKRKKANDSTGKFMSNLFLFVSVSCLAYYIYLNIQLKGNDDALWIWSYLAAVFGVVGLVPKWNDLF